MWQWSIFLYKNKKLTRPQGFKCERAIVHSEYAKVSGNHLKMQCFSKKKHGKLTSPNMPTTSVKFFACGATKGVSFKKKPVFGAKRNSKFALHQQGLLL
jgi:hypothetical protein